MEAALAVNASYFDMAGPMENIGFVESYKLLFTEWHAKFAAKGLTAFVGAGSSPGFGEPQPTEAERRSSARANGADHASMANAPPTAG